MFCRNCGKEIDDGSSFCTNCGAKIEKTNNQRQAPNQNFTTKAPMSNHSSLLGHEQSSRKGFFKGKEKRIGTSGEIKFNSRDNPKKKGSIIKKLFLFIVFVAIGFVAYSMFFGSNIASLEISSAIDPNTYAPTSIAEVFPTDTPEIYATFFISGLDIGTPIQGEWIYENQQAGIAELHTSEKNQNAFFSFSIPDNGWPTGSYSINIYIDGELETTKEFSIR